MNYLIFFLFITTFNLFSQERNYIQYFQKVHEADSLFVVGKYNESFLILNELFEEYEPLNQDLYYEMETYIRVAYHSGNKGVILPTLKRLVSEWGYSYNWLDLDIKRFVNLSKDEVSFLEMEYKGKIDYNMQNEVLSMNFLDQKFRRNTKSFKNKTDSLNRINQIDKFHYKKVLSYFTKGKYFDKRTVGSRTRRLNTSIDGILIHIIDEDKEGKLKVELLKQLRNGNISPYVYASVIDRDLLNNSKEQKFYSFGGRKNKGSFLEKVNSRRKEIGLSPIGYQDWKNSLRYNK